MSNLSITVWWLSGHCMTWTWWLNPASGVTSENSLFLAVPFCVGCVLAWHLASIPALPPPESLLKSWEFRWYPNTQLHPSSPLSRRYQGSVRHAFPFFVAISLDTLTLQWVLHLFKYGREAVFWKRHLSQQYYSPKSSSDIIMSKHL